MLADQGTFSGRERLLTVLRGGIPDRLPFVPLVNEYFWSTLPPEWDVQDPVSCCRRIGADIMERWVRSYTGYGLRRDDSPDPLATEGIRREHTAGNRLWIEYDTPAGVLSECLLETPEAGKTVFREEHLIKSARDLDAYQYLWERMEPLPAYQLTQDRIQAIGEDGLALVATPCTPLLHLIMYDAGLELTSYLLADYPERTGRLLEIMAEKAIEACRLAAESPAEAGIIPENSGTMLVSPAQFRRYCAPLLTRFADLFHAQGKPLLLHACGHLHGLVADIRDTGLDGIESLTPPPTGDTDLAYARQVLGRERTIIGGLDPVWFQRATPAEVEERVLAIIEQVCPGDHFMLMPSDSTPAAVPLGNFEAVRRAIDRFGVWHNRAAGMGPKADKGN